MVPRSWRTATRASSSLRSAPIRKARTLTEEIFQTALHGPALVLGGGVLGQRPGQLLDELLLLGTEARRDDNPHRHVQVAAALVAEMRHALAAHLEGSAGLGALGDGELRRLVLPRRGHLHRAAEGGLGEADGDLAV